MSRDPHLGAYTADLRERARRLEDSRPSLALRLEEAADLLQSEDEYRLALVQVGLVYAEIERAVRVARGEEWG